MATVSVKMETVEQRDNVTEVTTVEEQATIHVKMETVEQVRMCSLNSGSLCLQEIMDVVETTTFQVKTEVISTNGESNEDGEAPITE